jgi:hypothetical protein
MSRMLFTGDADMFVRHVMVVCPHDVCTPIGVIKLGHQGIHPSVPANRQGLCVTCFFWVPSGQEGHGHPERAMMVTLPQPTK